MKKKIILYSSTSVLVLAAIVILLNVISSYLFLRLDFSYGRIYSISKASKKILKALPDRLIIKAFFTKDLPQEFSANRRYIEDILSEYRAYSHGKISYSFIDPLSVRDAAQEANVAGIPPVRFTQIRRDKYEVKEAYMGILFIYGDKKEVLPLVRSVEGLEYDITNRIKRLLFPELKTIGLSSGQGETTSFERMSEMISERYRTLVIDLDKSTYVPEGLSALLVVGPKQKFSENSLLYVDQLLMKGIPVALFLDEFRTDLQSFFSAKIEHGLNEFLNYYGVKVLPGFVFDLQCEKISIRQTQGFFAIENIIAYPPYPLVSDLLRTNSITRDMDSVGLIFVSPLEIEKKEGFNYEILMRSSPKSWFSTKVRYINPYQQYFPAPSDKKGPFNLVAVITPDLSAKTKVTYKSFFSDRKGKLFKNILTQTSGPGRLLVIANSAFTSRETAFFMNILDWLSQDEDLISIRLKGASYRPLKVTSETLHTLVKYLSIFFIPALVILYGIFRWQVRKKMKKELKGIYT
ncbi:MAG: GldG family protein [Elusimicrobiota bacterium]